jgi:hypothetical protein
MSGQASLTIDLRKPLFFTGRPLEFKRLTDKGWKELAGAIHHGKGIWTFPVLAPDKPDMKDVVRCIFGGPCSSVKCFPATVENGGAVLNEAQRRAR